MSSMLKKDALSIALHAIEAVKPDEAVYRALCNVKLEGRIFLVSVGKAAWHMANAAVRHLDHNLYKGIVITKYDHVMGDIPNVQCYEAGHPVPDENSFAATRRVLDMTSDLRESDTVLFLLSGGGSALFEMPLIAPSVLQDVTKKLLASGADITQINTIRKRLSAVKGGRFAVHCLPAKIESIILSDIIGDPVDMIASGPAAPDQSTSVEALEIVRKYGLEEFEGVSLLCREETPKQISNVHTQIIGSVRELCRAAEKKASELGYECIYISDRLNGEASETGRWIGNRIKEAVSTGIKTALIAGGETVVHVKGSGLGGRNQELVLAAAEILDGVDNVAIISVGSDGTDGPTDAAGGYADGNMVSDLKEKGLDSRSFLRNNDAYHALQAVNNLVVTGPTGTNVNDLTVGLILDNKIS